MIQINEQSKIFHLSSPAFSYVLKVQDGQLLNLYWGAPLTDADLDYLVPSFRSGASFELLPYRLPLELPAVGTGWYGEAAIQAENADGNNITKLEYRAHKVLPHKPALQGLPHVHSAAAVSGSADNNDDGCCMGGAKVDLTTDETLQIQLVDELTGLEAVLSYTVLGNGLARSMELTNHGTQALKLMNMASACATIQGRDLEVIHLRGAHSRERQVVRTALGQSTYRVESQRGASGHEQNPFLALTRPHTTEFSGDVWAMNLIYSGSFAATAQVKDTDNTTLMMGLNPVTHRWLLEPGDSFQTPEALLAYSNEGLNGMSHVYHQIYRHCLNRSPWNLKERPILINNWEATYFNFNEEKILQIAERAAELGIELFVLDDGWFGVRNDDHRSLGDWYVNTDKLPGGISGIAKKVNDLGLHFGLWFEPEMISPNSDLYRAHPDWCLHAPGRSRTEARQQLILDLTRPEVQDFIIKMMKDTLSSAPITYVKWDMNRNMTEGFSAALPAERQMEVQHRYMLGLYRVLEEVTSAFPEVLFESCSGGGGRFDAGMLYYMPQTWTSDDTDAIERLGIQYGTSFAYPAASMGAHISASPNHQVGRVTTMQMRGDVALGGNFGFELDLSRLSAEDMATAKAFVEKVKALRGLTQNGEFTRLISPFNGSNYAAWQFADESRVLLCCYRKLNEPNHCPDRVFLRGLDPAARYTCEEGHTFSGSVLMNVGLPMDFFEHRDFASRVILFTKKEN